MTEPVTTGWPPSELMQDDCKALSKWLASRPDARRRVREAIARLDADDVRAGLAAPLETRTEKR